MKANELIIDKYYQDDFGRSGKLIKWVSSKKVEMDMEFSKLLISFESLEPIPLTEEWLLKFGFKPATKNNGNLPCYQMDIITHSSKTLTISRWKLADRDTSGICDWIYQIWVDYLDLYRIKYVHQLQDLYLSLTGEELKIKYENTIQNPNT